MMGMNPGGGDGAGGGQPADAAPAVPAADAVDRAVPAAAVSRAVAALPADSADAAAPVVRGGGRGGRGGPGAGRGGPMGRAGVASFGNGRRDRRMQYNGNASFTLDNSALDARSYSINGQDTPKPAYAKARASMMFGGPLKIPKLLDGQKGTFTFNYQLAAPATAPPAPRPCPPCWNAAETSPSPSALRVPSRFSIR